MAFITVEIPDEYDDLSRRERLLIIDKLHGEACRAVRAAWRRRPEYMMMQLKRFVQKHPERWDEMVDALKSNMNTEEEL